MPNITNPFGLLQAAPYWFFKPEVQYLLKRLKCSPRKPDNCWITGSTQKGYICMTVRGRRDRAHRLMFEAAYGWMPEVVLHKCDNPRCVNPRHLIGGTQQDNVRDRMTKGRGAKGSSIAAAKLDDLTVMAVRVLAKNGIPGAQIAKALKLHPSTVQRAISGERWGHVA